MGLENHHHAAGVPDSATGFPAFHTSRFDGKYPCIMAKKSSDIHDLLWEVCRKLPGDFEPYGEQSRDGHSDCSCGCVHYRILDGKLGYDWGICANPASPRAGLLTFEHQGCVAFEADPSDEVKAPPGQQDKAVSSFFEPDDPLRKLQIDEFEFFNAMDLTGSQFSEMAAYLNLVTGAVHVLEGSDLSFDEDDDDDDVETDEDEFTQARIDANPDEWFEIEPLDSQTDYQIMERFAEQITNLGIRDRLFEALTGPKPFRRFRDVVFGDGVLSDQWNEFEDSAKKEEIRFRLEAVGIEPEWINPNAQSEPT